MKRSSRIGLRVTPEEKKVWEQAAAQAGMSLSAYIVFWASRGTALLDDLKKPR